MRKYICVALLVFGACGSVGKQDAVVDSDTATRSDALSGCIAAGSKLVTSDSLNLRSGPGTTYGIVAVIPSGTPVTPVNLCSNGYWYNVTYNNQTGWSSGNYLQVVAGSGTTSRIATGDPAVDKYDASILAAVSKYRHPDAMFMKAQMAQESYFNPRAVSNNTPCGTPAGWTWSESQSFGLLQMTAACFDWFAHLPNGHANLTTDATSANWPTSVYNPDYNTDSGTRVTTGCIANSQARFPGCTTNQYVLMSAACYYWGSEGVLGCGKWLPDADVYVQAVLGRYRTLASKAGVPYPY